MKGELGITQCELSGKDSNKNNGPGEKQLARMELHLLWCCWNIICGVDTGGKLKLEGPPKARSHNPLYF